MFFKTMRQNSILRTLLTLLMVVCVTTQVVAQSREHLSMDRGWRFHLGDIPMPVIKGHSNSYNNAKAGRAWGAAAVDYDDTAWREVNVPHDWAVEGAFCEDANLSQGYRERGIGWYRRSFRLDEQDKGRYIELHFDGIATNATIWVNGTLMHRNWCGYTSMYIDITAIANYGNTPNVVAVRVDADAQEGWWYEGAGIYRHTWLEKRSPLHITTDGVFANPIRNAQGSWGIPIEVELNSIAHNDIDAQVEATLIDPAGREVARGITTKNVNPFRVAKAELNLNVTAPKLWSVDTPTLYSVKVAVKQHGKVVDEVTTKCGFRMVHFDKDLGFFLNDKPLKLQGTCNHQDHAGVGVAIPDALWEYRIRRLKEMGSNAYRCAHNPPSREFLDVCDSLGMLVMDENRHFNISDEYVRQLQWLVKRDRNRPSVIMWSVFNEEPMQGTEQGYQMVRRMVDVVTAMDNTRPVRAAMNGGLCSKINASHAVDVGWFNYQPMACVKFRESTVARCLTSSEDGSAFQIRGVYVNDRAQNLIGCYDDECANWGARHQHNWKNIETRPYLAGGFVWTGFDYRGEPTPLQWPTAGSLFGCMDLCGFPKTAYYQYQSFWIRDRPILEVFPHWNMPADSVGRDIRVIALSNADSVVLKLNGKVISGKKVEKYTPTEWSVPYHPGRLEVVAYNSNKQVAHKVVETTGEGVALRLTPDRETINGDGCDAMPITVEVVDAKGRAVPIAQNEVTFSISGAGQITGLGNGNPNSHEAEKGDKRRLFNGLAQVIIQSEEVLSGSAEPIRLTATAEGIKSHTLVVPVKQVEVKPTVKVEQPPTTLSQWLCSPYSTTKPNPTQQLDEFDMNSWQTVSIGDLYKFAESGYVVYRAVVKPTRSHSQRGGRVRLTNFVGRAEVYVNGVFVGKKESTHTSNFETTFDKITDDKIDLRVVCSGDGGASVGFNGWSRIE